MAFLPPSPTDDFEVPCTLQRRNLVSAVPVLISCKSFRRSALLEIKLITTNDIEGWQLTLHGSPYSSIFQIKCKWKFSCVMWEDCWKGSNIFKKQRNAIKLHLDAKAMRCSGSPEDSKTFSQIRELYKCAGAWEAAYTKVEWHVRREGWEPALLLSPHVRRSNWHPLFGVFQHSLIALPNAGMLALFKIS